MDGTVLVADDDRTIRTVLTQALTRAGCKVHATSSIETLMRWIREGMGDLVISDVVMPDGNGLEALPEIARIRPGLPVIVISAQNTIMTAIRATEARAYDYLPKPFDLPDLMKRAARALRVKRRRTAPATATAAGGAAIPAKGAGPVTGPDGAPVGASGSADEDRLPLVGRTPRMQALYRLVAGVINTSLPVLIRGPSGSGKSLIARAIHDFGNRRHHAFVVADMLDFARPEDLRRLFGQARNGTLLIEEVGDISPNEQGRLVRLLDRPEAGSLRVLATTRADLPARIRGGSFREDLYYRLCGVEIEVPELRERIEDIPLLARHFLARAQARAAAAAPGGARLHLSEAAIEALCRYSWPGNVRQLEHAIKRLAATVAGPEIGDGDVEQLLHSQPGDDRHCSEGGDVQQLSDAVARHLRRYFDLHQGTLPPPGLYGRILREVERPLIGIALEATAGNQARCASLLGINRNTLRKKITDLDIRVTRGRKLM